MFRPKDFKKLDYDELRDICKEELNGYISSSKNGIHFCGLERGLSSWSIAKSGDPVVYKKAPSIQDLFPFVEKAESHKFPTTYYDYYGYTTRKFPDVIPNVKNEYVRMPISGKTYGMWMKNCSEIMKEGKKSSKKCMCESRFNSKVCSLA